MGIKKMSVTSLAFTVYCPMSDVHVHLIFLWVLWRGNELQLPRARITLMTLKAALCAATSDLCSSSSPKDEKRHTHTHISQTYCHTFTHTHTYYPTRGLIDLALRDAESHTNSKVTDLLSPLFPGTTYTAWRNSDPKPALIVAGRSWRTATWVNIVLQLMQ